jgi:hypothetical protein
VTLLPGIEKFDAGRFRIAFTVAPDADTVNGQGVGGNFGNFAQGGG